MASQQNTPKPNVYWRNKLQLKAKDECVVFGFPLLSKANADETRDTFFVFSGLSFKHELNLLVVNWRNLLT